MPMQTAFLCRTNAPLIKAAFQLHRMTQGRIKIRLLGRDIAMKLKEIIGDILGTRRNCSVAEFEILAEAWINSVRAKYAGLENAEKLLSEMEDYYHCVTTLAKQCEDARGVYKLIDESFVDRDDLDDDPQTVIFASGHRSKGFEWDRVIVLRSDLMPHPSSEGEADLKQEDHIAYIIKTRAKKALWMAADAKPD